MDHFRESFEGLHKATVEMQAAHGHLVEASQCMQRAGDAMTAAMTSVLHAKEEHEDLRETVTRLETLVLDIQRRLPPPS